MQTSRLNLLVCLLALLLLAGCTQPKPKYVIGVSQCSADIWREKQNAELRMGSYLQDNVELRFAAAYDSDERQVQQIDSLVQTGIDLLIVAPNQVATISPAIDRAYDHGIPVIVFERKTNSAKYTAYIGADNYEMGRVMGEYIASSLHGQGRVLEVMGLKGSSPAIERHKGFTDAIGRHAGIEVVGTLQGDWTEQSAYQSLTQSLAQGKAAGVDFVFGQNDRMAIGARRAYLDHAKRQDSTTSGEAGASAIPRFCGIDGLPGEAGGIRQVCDSILDATYIYPTHGDELLALAVDILEGKPYEKEVMFMSALVTRDNARSLLMQSDEMMRQAAYLDQLHEKANDYLQRLSTQRVLSVLAICLVVLLLALAVIAYRYHLQRIRINEEREQMARAQLDFYTQAAHQLRTPLTLIDGPLAQLAATPDMQQAGQQAQSMLDIVRRNADQLTEVVNKILKPTPGASNGEDGQDVHAQEKALMGDARQDDPVDFTPAEPAEGTGETGRPLLLVVDDNDDIRTYLRTILQDRYELLEAPNGQEGLVLACREVPDLIVSDVMMPVMNGLEFCQRVKDDVVTSHIPVILLTARALSQHQVEGYRSGADAYITKPFQPDVLQARIANLLRQRFMLRQLWAVVPSAAPLAEQAGKTAETPAAADHTKESIPAPMENAFIKKLQGIIETRMTDSDLSVEDLGADIGLSRVQLYRKVKALTGLSPVEMVRKTRLQKAREQLLTTDLSVSEVAYQTGFSSPSYFTKCFKEEYGISPTELTR